MNESIKNESIRIFFNYKFIRVIITFIMTLIFMNIAKNVSGTNQLFVITYLLITIFMFIYSTDRWVDLINFQHSCTARTKSNGGN